MDKGEGNAAGTTFSAEGRNVRISVIVPMRNEADRIPAFIGDIANQDFVGDVEVIVADGGSADGSAETLLRETQRREVPVTLLRNEAQWVSHGLNACIGEATGDLLVRLDCHSRYPTNYLSQCWTASEETGAAVVGGVIVARGGTPVERAVACAMDSPFGGIGFYRILTPREGGRVARLRGLFGLGREPRAGSDGRVETDTVTFGAFRRETFGLVGVFDESLRRNQDDELSLRVRLAGGRIVLDPKIRVYYTPRGSLVGVVRQYYEYGYWKVAVMAKHRTIPGPRSMMPLGLVGSVGPLALAGRRSAAARRLLAAEVGLYGTLALVASATTVRRRGEHVALIPLVCATFPAFHLGYGLGMLLGLVRAGRQALMGTPQRF